MTNKVFYKKNIKKIFNNKKKMKKISKNKKS